MKISLCIATCCRPDRLGLLLDDLVRQEQIPHEVVVVDNDTAGTALPVVQLRRERGSPFPIHYEIQPVKNISLTRNRTVAIAVGEWLAFIDDDERAPPSWLKQLTETMGRYGADAVLGPVDPVLPADAPAWIRRGRFYEWTRMKTGEVVPVNKLRFGNALLRGELLRDTSEPFDPDYGLTGGEDGDLLGRLVQRGARIVWCDEAIVREPVDAARLCFRWLVLRSLRGGQDFARRSRAGRYGPVSSIADARLFVRSLLQAGAAALLALLSWPAGRHHAAFWLLKFSANLGKLSIFLGWHYREYAREQPVKP